MTYTTQKFASFEDYLTADPSDLPEGRYEYWDGELVAVMTESLGNDRIANSLYFLLRQAGVYHSLIRPGKVEICVPGRPRTRFPDLIILDDVHLTLMSKNARLTQTMPPPRLLVEVVSPGNENSDNYIRDYIDKPKQYAAIGVPELWLIDPDREWIQVGTLSDNGYQFETFTGQNTIVSPTFPKLDLTTAQVLSAE